MAYLHCGRRHGIVRAPVSSFSRNALFSWLSAKALGTGVLLAAGFSVFGQDVKLESVGVRFGFYPYGHVEDFYQADACAAWTLPWGWDLDPVWHLQTRLDAALGWIGEGGTDAAICSSGPTLCLSRQNVPLVFEAGCSPTVLTRTVFPSKDLGFPFQFTTHAGLDWDLGGHFRLTYRFQHMSNASIARPNPGLNFHMLGVSYLF